MLLFAQGVVWVAYGSLGVADTETRCELWELAVWFSISLSVVSAAA